MCRSHSKESAAQLGHSSAASISVALRRWASIHMWSLQRIVEVFAHRMDGGVDDHLESQHTMVFVLSPGEPDPAERGNPARAFIIESSGIIPRDEQEFLDLQWPRVDSICKDYAQCMRPKLREAERRAFAGFIPATFHFKMTGLVMFTQYPLYCLQGHEKSTTPRHSHLEEQGKLFDDVTQLYVGLINMGMVLWVPGGDDNLPFPEAGFYRPVKKNSKMWKWVDAPDWDWELGPGSAPALYGTITEMLTRYHNLLVQCNFQ